jgi:hypothetical protein
MDAFRCNGVKGKRTRSRVRMAVAAERSVMISTMLERGSVTVTLAAYFFAMVVASSAPAATKRVSGRNCSFRFTYPDSWAAVENPEAAILDPERHEKLALCAIGLQPRHWAAEMRESPLRLSAYPVRLVFWNRSFANSARRSCFIRVSDIEAEQRPSSLRQLNPWDWGIGVRQGIDAAHQFTTRCCQGVRGTSWGHAVAKNGSKATIVWDCAVVNDRQGHSLIIQSDNEERFRAVVSGVIDSISFDVTPRQ